LDEVGLGGNTITKKMERRMNEDRTAFMIALVAWGELLWLVVLHV